jgi:hypothetical protein
MEMLAKVVALLLLVQGQLEIEFLGTFLLQSFSDCYASCLEVVSDSLFGLPCACFWSWYDDTRRLLQWHSSVSH